MKIFWTLLFSCVSLFGKQSVDFLFYVQDAGETNALIPVIESLREKGYKVLSLTAGAAEDLIEGKNVLKLENFGIEISKNWNREERLETEILVKILDEIEPRAVITGVAYAAQGQLLEAYKGRPTFAYWDNFNSNGENPYFQTARKVAEIADTLIVPTSSIEKDFPRSHKVALGGQPTIEVWRREMKGREKEKRALFVGGYGKDYEEAFSLFLKCARGAPDFEYLVQLHPKVDGSFEKAALEKYKDLPIRILSGISTIDAVASSSLVICHQSTVGFQALACGKKVVHLIPEGQVFDSLPLRKGIASKAETPEEYLAALKLPALSFETFDEIMGIPSNSTECLVSILIESLYSDLNQP